MAKNKATKKKKEKRPMNAREKSMIIVTVLMIVILFSKSIFFDEVKNLSGDELKFSKFIELTVDETYEGFIFDKNIVVLRTNKIFLANSDVKTKIGYIDETTGEKVEEIIDGRYTAVVRHYLFGVLPFKQSSITAAIVDESIE